MTILPLDVPDDLFDDVLLLMVADLSFILLDPFRISEEDLLLGE